MTTASRSARPSDETIWNVAATDAEAPRREDEQLALEMDRPRP